MHVRIDPSGVLPVVEIEGVNVAGMVRRVTLDLNAGRPPEVFLELAPGHHCPDVLDCDAVVHVLRDGADVRTWLERIDAEALEQAVLNDADLSTSFGQSFLDQLIKMAESDGE